MISSLVTFWALVTGDMISMHSISSMSGEHAYAVAEIISGWSVHQEGAMFKGIVHPDISGLFLFLVPFLHHFLVFILQGHVLEKQVVLFQIGTVGFGPCFQIEKFIAGFLL